MPSKYQMWLTFNGETEKIRFPVLPEKINIKNSLSNKSINIDGLSEVVIAGVPNATVISFSCFFPAASFPGVQIKKLAKPEALKKKIIKWQQSKQPVHFIVTGTSINLFCIITEFSCSEQGGDVGTLHYSISLKEYKEIHARRIKLNKGSKKATAPAKTVTRTDNRAPKKTYTVAKGDTLWAIAAKYLGSGNQYTKILKLNSDKIKNPNLIYPGTVLKLPA